MEMLLVHVLVMSVLLMIVAKIVPGIEVEGFGQALLAALVLGVMNFFVRPVLVLLTLPFTIVTLGLFLLIINALLLKLCAAVVPGLKVKGFGSAFLGALLLAIFSAGLTLAV